MSYYDVSLTEVTDELLENNKQLTLENIVLQKSLEKAKAEVDRLETTIAIITEAQAEAHEAEVPWETIGDGPIDAGSVETVMIYDDESLDTQVDTDA